MSKRTTRYLAYALLLGIVLSGCDREQGSSGGYVPRWQSIVETDPANGSSNVQMMVAAMDRSPSEQNPVALVLSCQNRNTDVYVIWRQYLGVYDVEVSWRVGKDETVTESWSLSTDNEATFAPQPVQLIKRMMGNDQFLIKAAPFNSAPVTHVFDTGGLLTEVEPLRKACGW